MTEEFNVLDEFEEVEEVEDSGPRRSKTCMTAMAIMLVFVLLFLAAVPLARFLFRKNYERQMANFPVIVCEQVSEAGLNKQCDSSLSTVDFVSKTFPIGESKNFVTAAMQGFPLQEQTGIDQPGCKKPVLWKYSVAKSFIGWQTEVRFFFCSDFLVERIVLVNGAPLNIPTYDL